PAPTLDLNRHNCLPHHSLSHSLFLILIPPATLSSLFPYTTLFRSRPISDTITRFGATWTMADYKSENEHRLEICETGRWLHQKGDRKSTRLNSSHVKISYAVFCLKKKKQTRGCASSTQREA